jgi:hypothetical protein
MYPTHFMANIIHNSFCEEVADICMVSDAFLKDCPENVNNRPILPSGDWMRLMIGVFDSKH